jgi:hypothetical protein|tara:strand:+ start:390 stop:626 length:237 start_codon:yes stop_codon:yes gene_type:complete
MSTDIRIQAEEAKRLKNDTAFQQFVQDVREDQMRIFANSAAQEIERREEAHAILRALNLIEVNLDAAIAAETLLDRKK